jgi:hypothetical protein
MRDAGTMVMFAGTPYAHLHVCGSPWDGNEYHQAIEGVDNDLRSAACYRQMAASSKRFLTYHDFDASIMSST